MTVKQSRKVQYTHFGERKIAIPGRLQYQIEKPNRKSITDYRPVFEIENVRADFIFLD